VGPKGHPEGHGLIFRLRWWLKYRKALKPKNRWFDRETGRYLYRYAAYCVDCRRPVMEEGALCKECQRDTMPPAPPTKGTPE